MEALLRRGTKEVVLTGIDLAAYRDPASGMGLKELLLFFEGQPTPPRIRLSSVDPEYLDADFIALLAASGKIAKSIHIPVQSGSDRILKAMGRRYSSASIADLVKRLRPKHAGHGHRDGYHGRVSGRRRIGVQRDVRVYRGP